jgi:DNA helicase HerA-like ATPase
MTDTFIIARTQDGRNLEFEPRMGNRHGLITGATGTGKTISLQLLADHFSQLGVPVFLADVKSDLSGVAARGSLTPKLKDRLASTGMAEPAWSENPVVFWDVFGKRGFPVRATISDVGPLLLGRLFNLNPTQQGVLSLVFKVGDDNGLLLLDLKDLQAILQFVGENARQFTTQYGNVSSASIGAIQRALLEIEQQGGDKFFGEPMLDVGDLVQTDSKGRGVVNVLVADELVRLPKLYATFLLWLLSELFERLPEIGDPDKPVLVFFFDEAHLLFNDAPPALVEKIEQVVRLIRSKGVGVYFVTQSPGDVPDKVLGQLGNRVQHALRAFTPRDQKAVKIAAETLRANPKLDTGRAITELAVGEALVSLLDGSGSPQVTERAWMAPPASHIGPVPPAEFDRIRQQHQASYGHYDQAVDRESAYERLKSRTLSKQPDEAPAEPAPPAGPARTPGVGRGSQHAAPAPGQPSSAGGLADVLSGVLFGTTGPRGGHHDGLIDSAARSAARSVGSNVGRALVRGVLGSILGGRSR